MTGIVDGQKVWTSGGHLADLGMLLARTNPDAPKHRGITWFALDMHQPGVEVRPLREMTGTTRFSEVFFSSALVNDDARIGDVDAGWGVANTTLLYERTGMGASGSRGEAMVAAGRNGGNLERRAGDFVAPRPRVEAGADVPRRRSSSAQLYIDLARRHGRASDPLIRQRLVRLHTLGELARLNTERSKAARSAGREVPGVANFSKLAMGESLRQGRDLGLELLGPRAMLHAYTREERAVLDQAVGEPDDATVTAQALGAQALPIFGGTDQIQRNIVGERVLGLPKEPGDQSQVPFSELRKNG